MTSTSELFVKYFRLVEDEKTLKLEQKNAIVECEKLLKDFYNVTPENRPSAKIAYKTAMENLSRLQYTHDAAIEILEFVKKQIGSMALTT